MGMRATIAYVEATGKTFVTTVQWATRLDQTIGHYLHSERENGVAVNESAKDLIAMVTKNHGHISALEISDAKDVLRTNDIPVSNSVVIAGHQSSANVFNSELEASAEIYDNELDGGSIGAVYRENKPDSVEFFWVDPTSYDLIKRNSGTGALANFYSDVHGKPSKLKKMSFRTR